MRGRGARLGAVILLLVFAGLPAWGQNHTEFFQGQEVVAGDVLVKFRAANALSVAQLASALDVDAVRSVGGIGVLLLHSRSKSVEALVKDLAARTDVIYAEPNYILYAVDTVPNDPRFGELYGLQNTGQPILGSPGTPGADISAAPAWDTTTGSQANVVAVVDTGIDYNHPDLTDNVWSAPTDFTVTFADGSSVSCAAGTHGFNAITNVCDPLDDNNHGTHVSGTIGAAGNNGIGVVGVNWTASIMGAKFLSANGSGTTEGAIKAIEFVVQAKAIFGADANVRVLSNSWGGGGFSQALLDEINRASDNDMLFVVAAGNNNRDNDAFPFYPASYNAPNIIAVAATDNQDARAFFSNFGANSVHLGAPGVNVLSTVRNANYAYFSGTSMATPHVSGAAALVLSVCALDTPTLKATLLANADAIDSLSGITITGGRLNVNATIQACLVGATSRAGAGSAAP
jgi:subtilisin family serine protease